MYNNNNNNNSGGDNSYSINFRAIPARENPNLTWKKANIAHVQNADTAGHRSVVVTSNKINNNNNNNNINHHDNNNYVKRRSLLALTSDSLMHGHSAPDVHASPSSSSSSSSSSSITQNSKPHRITTKKTTHTIHVLPSSRSSSHTSITNHNADDEDEDEVEIFIGHPPTKGATKTVHHDLSSLQPNISSLTSAEASSHVSRFSQQQQQRVLDQQMLYQQKLAQQRRQQQQLQQQQLQQQLEQQLQKPQSHQQYAQRLQTKGLTNRPNSERIPIFSPTNTSTNSTIMITSSSVVKKSSNKNNTNSSNNKNNTQSDKKSDLEIPIVTARVSHSYEYIRTSVVQPGSLIGPCTSQVFQVPAEDVMNFDPAERFKLILEDFKSRPNDDEDTVASDAAKNNARNINVVNITTKPVSSVAMPNDDGNDGDDDDDERPHLATNLSNNNNGENDNDITFRNKNNATLVRDNNNHDTSFTSHQVSPQSQPQIQRTYQQQQQLNNSLEECSDLDITNKPCPLVRKNSMRRKDSSPLSKPETGGMFRKESLLKSLASTSKEVKKSSSHKSRMADLGSVGNKSRDNSTTAKKGSKPQEKFTGASADEPMSEASTEYLEKSYEKIEVVLRKEEGGYGITLRGQQPVLVNSVRENGVAAKNNVREGDIIFKINGKLVAKQGHESVVNSFQIINHSYSCHIVELFVRCIGSYNSFNFNTK
ncbi:hypothetical protein HELRODRAFT_165614 [Helobdella robusta]|uniref:PDZ domain-containing protein n=1 Tax=Helobdella robusta TaxID=6412 RepID=T1EX30_HELRO|nr:hypothetical protein HELRODRAFT_165614 [Helobdella robusta]ESN91562.1 hypothetical protein HELRODRAFT_165614 [Helobdella robusta]